MGTNFSAPFRCITSTRLILFSVAGLAMAIMATPSSAQTPPANNCLQDEYKAAGNKQKLNCTANDVRVAKVINVRDLSGAKLTECQPGNFSFIADFLVQTTSSSARSNIGLYFSLNDVNTQPTALTGSCSDNIISPPHTCPGGTATCGSSAFEELDPNEPKSGSPIGCGDSSSSDPSVCLDASNNVVSCSGPHTQTFTATQIVTVRIDNFPCTAPSGTNQLVLPNCTSWQVPGSTIACTTTAPDYPYNIAAIPGSPSKCNCDTIPLGITVQSPSVTVSKACTTTDTPGNTNTSCDIKLPAEGGQVIYTVNITNNSNFGDVVIDEICDDQYGSIFTASQYTPACPAGTIGTKGTLGTTTCTGATVTKGSTYTCTFNATQAEDVTVTDTVTARGHGTSAGTFGPSSSSSVTVTSHEAPTTASVTKSLVSTRSGCATVRYQVDFKNTSGTGTDETVTLHALSDNGFGDITSVHGSVFGTTCGQPTTNTNGGTLASTPGAGTLPTALAVNGHYICQFDAQFCSDLGTIVTIPGTCSNGTCSAGNQGASCTTNTQCDVTCNGIHHTNQVTGQVTNNGLTGDEGESVTESANTLTVNECFASSSSSTP